MKHYLTFLPSLLSALVLNAQDILRAQTCDPNPYEAVADSLKTTFTAEGYTLLREAAFTMESEYEMPVVFPLTQGQWYRFVFVGDPGSRLYEVRMFDQGERQVAYKKHLWGDIDGNVLVLEYIPDASGRHILMPVQINKKKKSLCGYVMLLRRQPPTE